MIDKIHIEQGQAEVYDLSAFGMEAHILCKEGKIPELWDSDACWKISGLNQEEYTVSLVALDPPETKLLRLSVDDFDVLYSLISPFMEVDGSEEIISDEEIEPIFSEEI